VLHAKLGITTPEALMRADRRVVHASMSRVRPRPTLEDVSRWQDRARDLVPPGPTVTEPGWDQVKMKHSEWATAQGKERIERKGNVVTVYGTVMRSHYTPDIVRVKDGDKVIFAWTNVETAEDATHGFGLHGWNVNLSIDPGATDVIAYYRQTGL